MTYLVHVGDLVWKRHIDQLRNLDGHLLERDSELESREYDLPQPIQMECPLQIPETEEESPLEKDITQPSR